jgi:hypothetical protein
MPSSPMISSRGEEEVLQRRRTTSASTTTAVVDSSFLTFWDPKILGSSFSESFLHSLLSTTQLSHLEDCIRSWQERSLNNDPSSEWDPMKCDLNDLTTDQNILPETQLVLVKILLAMEFQMCQGIILVLDCKCCHCKKRKEQQEEKKKIHLDEDANMVTDDDIMYRRNYCYYHAGEEKVHNHDSHDVSPFLAMELLTQFKYGNGVETKEDEFPVIRISYAYAATENRATSFLRNAVKKDRMQKIRVLCCGTTGTVGRHPWKGNYHHG